MPAPYDKADLQALDTFAFEQITVAAAAVGFTAATFNPTSTGAAIAAHCKVETAAIRLRADGTNPSATVGTPYEPGEEFVVWGSEDLASTKFIRRDATSAVLNVSYAR